MTRRWLSVLLVALSLLGNVPVLSAQQPIDPALVLLRQMPPAARIGQLFLVTFPGTDLSENSEIYRLVVEERIGGVLLAPENGNIVNEGNTPAQVAALTSGLQKLAWEAARTPLSLSEVETTTVPFVPLFIAIRHGEREYGRTLPISGTLPLPSPMALGATWNPAYAETVGQILGEELRALGINMFLGPPLDVVDTPRPGAPTDLGIASFGGDPFWVGQMGKAYIRGIHTGSGGQVAVVPDHFPGLGAADRPLSEEVSTVQKSVEQLRQIELAPFLAVTGAVSPTDRPDGLLVVPIRYRGFQGNIYASTKPITFDPQALQQLLALPEVAPWRESGGLMVADELGVRAIRRFYDPSEQKFPHLRVALEAFLAGNDLLILSRFASTDDWASHFANIRQTLAFFRDKYATDPAFQARVDEAALRILRLKLRLYGYPFTLTAVQVDPQRAADRVARRAEEIPPISRSAVSLLSPPTPDLLPDPPAPDETIVIFTDDRQVAPCAECAPTYLIPPTLVAETLVRLYGPQGTGQVLPSSIQSFTFSDLTAYLNTSQALPSSGGTPGPVSRVALALQNADWILFAMLDAGDRASPSGAVRRFLAERADLLRNKKAVVFAFGAPYYLDTTEIAKLSAYFGLYSPTPPFVEAAVRALFTEFPLTGDPPVSVPGINYFILTQTQPDPQQTIQLFIAEAQGSEMGTPQPLEIYQGDTLHLRTSVIVDRNGHPVPDGTLVEFILTYPQEGLERTIPTTTRGGIAETAITLDRIGQLQISVRAEPAPRAVRLEMEIRQGEPAVIVPITPTPSPVPTPTPEPTPVPTLEPTPAAPVPRARETSTSRAGMFLQGLLGSLAGAVVGYVGSWRRRAPFPHSVRAGLWGFIGGLSGYLLVLLLRLAGWEALSEGFWPGVAALLGAAFALTAEMLKK
ncbi:MAG: glycoside hydrolase family 3 N-terminal domain-containing protein [Anaerolineae bacterium]|nr:hypothetical protein [Anaerolineae bacterium]MCX8068278.1 hypothetical protein [Anaerolineae bacterium]MDW7990957.1 glycoside hydrolase family 3 N-terminal domain-containing protein [Anaerolineae bacterium]